MTTTQIHPSPTHPADGPVRVRSERGTRRLITMAMLTALLVGLVGCAAGTGLSREQVIEQVDTIGTLNARLYQAREEGLDVLAPQGMESARNSLDEAVSTAQEGRTANAERLAKQGLESLDRAVANSKQTSSALREVLQGRQRAIAADAPTLLPEQFETLEASLRKAAQMAESGNIGGAKKARPELLTGYSKLELDALKNDATDLARRAIEKARKGDAERYAPDTFGRAKKELGIAVGILETDRSQVAQANVHSRRAAEYAARSQYITEIVQEFDRRDYEPEEIVLWYQEQLEDVTAPLEGGIAFIRPNHEVIADARGRIAATVSGERDASEQLAAAKLQIVELELSAAASTQDLTSRLEQVQKAQREAEARYARISAMFSENVAEVSRRGQDVLLDTYGFDFAVGDSEIRSNNFALLNKIALAIGEFQNPKVVVMGHTDSTGATDTNQKLSEERAQKVGEFLVQIGGLDPSRVTTRGFGESKPVANNETPEGRARNRRIEVLIVND